ncbi:MAG TPA: hypothetical protein VGQ28_10230 [Thermoanaerobaculia bacterium]|nr:hypothetical protein [Thermoanaerobaculia bacterium]
MRGQGSGLGGEERYNPPVNAARRTLGRWLFAAFLERGCDPAPVRRPRRVHAIRPLTPREMAELSPLAGSLVSLSNLLPLPRLRRRHATAP